MQAYQYSCLLLASLLSVVSMGAVADHRIDWHLSLQNDGRAEIGLVRGSHRRFKDPGSYFDRDLFAHQRWHDVWAGGFRPYGWRPFGWKERHWRRHMRQYRIEWHHQRLHQQLHRDRARVHFPKGGRGRARH